MANVSMINGHIDETKPQILDSGDRTQFESGAVRDMQKGKGRCDLLPLDVVAELMCDELFFEIDSFQHNSNVCHLMNALQCFVEVHGQWNNPISMILEVAKHFEEGAEKYGENNWQKGLPVKSYINSAVRHYLKFMRGDQDEPHDRAFCWNILCAIWTCRNKPELNDYAKDGVE